MDPLATLTHPNPLMPPAKQKRILIWRNEVAYAISPLQSDTPSLASSSSHASSSDEPSLRAVSRPRSLWRRLSSRLSVRSGSSRERKGQTDMYADEGNRQARMAGLLDEEDADMGDAMPLGEESSRDGGRGIKDKQDRLHRAARLLHQSILNNDGPQARKH